MMPEMDGDEVCRQLKADEATRDIPIIFVTAMGKDSDETRGLELGAVDYITKPIRPSVVKARVLTHLKLREAMLELKRLYSTALDSNPMTGLPGNNSVANRIKQALQENEALCVIYSDLDNFKAFNDKYGFALGDEALLFASKVLQDAVKAVKASDAFVGHIGGDDFVVIVPSQHAKITADEISQRFDEGIVQFYSQEDRAAKCIHSINRQGEKEIFPLMSISLAGVDLSHQVYKRYIEVNDACAGAKKMAKALPGSSFFMDRRSK
jgi:diguanylate cyclase (GGDEF)-like protein